MRWESLKENCFFAFSPELEAFLGAFSLLCGEAAHHVCTDLYGARRIEAWQRQYRFLFETHNAVKDLAPSPLEFLLDHLSADFTLPGLRAYIFSLPPEQRLFRQVEWRWFGGTTQEELLLALTDDAALDTLFGRVEERCSSFLGVSSFVRQNDRYLSEFFALAEELDTQTLRDALREQEPAVEAFRAQTAESLASAEPLECAQKLMGKTFHNRGPYETFYFMPSLLLPFASMRFFYDNGTPHNKQILLCSIREPERAQEDTIAALKALADETRYQIMMLLARSGPVSGQEIVRALKLAPSTVSHHMTELRERGLVTEEQVKTAKYYGVSRKSVWALLEAVERDLKLDADKEKK
ncbi:MAG: winged helix-turn-helix transcriptional regulator [Oscillospiraceae bacterium]|nr:winged helix-turn-helix transcriptional regulator [Oscillospiraceae bacterium]